MPLDTFVAHCILQDPVYSNGREDRRDNTTLMDTSEPFKPVTVAIIHLSVAARIFLDAFNCFDYFSGKPQELGIFHNDGQWILVKNLIKFDET